MDITPQHTWEGVLHLAFAAGFFLALAFFSLVLFRKTDPSKPPTRRKLQRNAIYTFCGYTILICLGLIAVLAFVSDTSPIRHLIQSFGSRLSLRLRSAYLGL